MPLTPSTSSTSAPVDAAFEALKSYDHGAARSTLMPLDDAIAASCATPTLAQSLEKQLIAALVARPSVVASEYICAKLALIGSKSAVPALAALIGDPDRAEPARNALELIPCVESVHELRENLAKLTGTHRIGVIHSLGARRDAHSVPELCFLLNSPDAPMARAAAAALGRVGNKSAANALNESLSRVPAVIRTAVADACLACAEQLERDQGFAEARALYGALIKAPVAEHVRLAAERGLARGS
jgi:HEAT repeat protein